MACKNRKYKTAGANSKHELRKKGALDKYGNILDTALFRKLNKAWSQSANKRFGLKGQLFLEENNKAYLNTDFAHKIDKAKGINYTPAVQYSRHAGLNPIVTNHEQPDKPLGDNYAEFLHYKNTQLKEISRDIEIARANAKNNNTSENRAKLKELQKLSQVVKNQLEMLEQNKVDYMFHAINQDLARIRETLNSKELYAVQEVSDKLDFYKDFVKSLVEYDHEDFDSINSEITKLQVNQEKANEEKIKEFLGNEELTQALLENLNSDDKLKKKLITEKGLKGEEAENFEITVDDLLIANSDISWGDLKLLGTISDNTGNTILPQALMVAYKRVLSEKQAHASDVIAKFEKIEKDTGIKDPDWIIQKDEHGNPTEYVTDVFSTKWFDALKARQKMMYGLYTAIRGKQPYAKSMYQKLINWHKNNAVVIDFTRLHAVKAIYGSQYSSHFTLEDEHMDTYEASLKKQLGPRYKETIDKVLSKLQEFEELKATAKENYGEFAEKNVAASDLWEFNKQYKAGNPGTIKYTYGDNQEASTYFTSFENLITLPKTKTTETKVTDTGFEQIEKDSGFYNKEFQELMKDPDKVKYWNAIKDMSNYLDAVYSRENQGRISYPKRLKSASDKLVEDLNLIKKSPRLFGKLAIKNSKALVKFWGSQYTEKVNKGGTQEGVQSNLGDATAKAIADKTQLYILQGYPADMARDKASQEAMKFVSHSTGANFKAAVIEAAMHESRLEVEPLAKAALQRFRNIKDIDGNERENAIKKFEYFVDKIILNKTFGSKPLGIEGSKNKAGIVSAKTKKITSDWLMTRNDLERELAKQWKEARDAGVPMGEVHIEQGGNRVDKNITIYDPEDAAAMGTDAEITYSVNGATVTEEEFNKAYGNILIDKINSIGATVTAAGVAQGLISTLYLKALGLSPSGGIFNRVEGKHSAMIMDTLGKFWTKGNIHTANRFLAGANTIRFSNWVLRKTLGSKGFQMKEQLQIFEEVVKRLGVLQDKKSELEKQDESTINKFSAFLFSFAVDNPEFKSQGAVMHSIMQDATITDSEGNPHPLFNTETMEFTAFEMIDGALHIKPEFELTEDGGFHFDSPEMAALILKMETAISHSQGNYNASDALELQASTVGRLATTFTRWLPEALHSRFGIRGFKTEGEINASLILGGQKTEGRYVTAARASATSLGLFLGIGLAIPFGLMTGLIAMGLGVGAAAIVAKQLDDSHPRAEMRTNAFIATEGLQFLRSVLIEFTNLGKAGLYRKSGEGIMDIQQNKSFENLQYMTQEDIGALQSLTREVAIGLGLFGLSLAVEAARYGALGGDDDEESDVTTFLNYVINQLHKTSNSLTIYSNPASLVTDNGKLAILTEANKILNILNPPVSTKEKDLTFYLKNAPVPIPGVFLKNGLPWQQDKVLAERTTTMSGLPMPFYRSTDFMKDQASGGELQTSREYKAFRAERQDEIEEQFRNEGLRGLALKKAVAKAMRKKVPRKKKGETYEHVMERLKDAE